MKLKLFLLLALSANTGAINAEEATTNAPAQEQEESAVDTPQTQALQPLDAQTIQATAELYNSVLMGHPDRTKKALIKGAIIDAVIKSDDLTAREAAALLVHKQTAKIGDTQHVYKIDATASLFQSLSALTAFGAALTGVYCGGYDFAKNGTFANTKAAAIVAGSAFGVFSLILGLRTLYWKQARERLKTMCLLDAVDCPADAQEAADAVNKKITLDETREFYTNLAQMQQAKEALEDFDDME